MRLIQQTQKWSQSSLLQNIISTFGGISRDISEGPNGLLPHVENGGGEKFDKDWNGTGGDHDLGVLRSAGSDIS